MAKVEQSKLEAGEVATSSPTMTRKEFEEELLKLQVELTRMGAGARSAANAGVAAAINATATISFGFIVPLKALIANSQFSYFSQFRHFGCHKIATPVECLEI